MTNCTIERKVLHFCSVLRCSSASHSITEFQLMECGQECWISTTCANAPPSDLSNDLVRADQMLWPQARSLPSKL